MNLGIIIQARMESTRLPGKVYKKVLDRHLLEWSVLRCKKSKLVKKIIVAIPDTKESSVLIPIVKKSGAELFLGSLDNVLERYVKAAEEFQVDTVIRITSDCPLIDPALIDQAVRRYSSFEEKPDYFFIEGYPFGLGDIEIVKLETLKKILQLTKDPAHLEHVVAFIAERPDLFKIKTEKAPHEFLHRELRVCVDEPEDFLLVEKIIEHFGQRDDFSTNEILDYLDKNPEIAEINKKIRHNFIIPREKK